MGRPRVFFGKHRGTVHANRDPSGRGRLRVGVPDVLGPLDTGWALPLAGPGMSGFFLPPVGANVPTVR